MAVGPEIIQYTANTLNLNAQFVHNVLELLIKEQCTIPFITRYRKERTGGMDEVQIQNIQTTYEEYVEREKRREYILETITKMEKMTPALKKEIKSAQTLNQLEDIYAPFKSKRKTKATIAKEAGLGPLALKILNDSSSIAQLQIEMEKDLLNLDFKINSWEDALAGAQDIIIETFAHDSEIKENLRKTYWEKAKIVSLMAKDAKEIEDHTKYQDYFEFDQLICEIKEPKNSYRFLAIRRGVNQKILKMSITIDDAYALTEFKNKYFTQKNKLNSEFLEKCVLRSYTNYIHSSLELEIKAELKKLSDEAAISIFGTNLKNLLLQPYLGAKTVMAIDPGIRTGCKVAIVDETGKFIIDTVIYPHGRNADEMKSAAVIQSLIDQFKVLYIAIGNGTYGRETLEFLESDVPSVKRNKVHATLISEAGASIYSASEIARKEFPDKDPTVRGAISIARRFQDPLAELVKIDPKSIGVGQYQHDVSQTKLKKSLVGVVENCVNFVGVNLNTASPSLLSYVSGIGSSLAEKVVDFRQKNGNFKNRKDLLTVPRFSDKIFEQSAGFLRIYNGDNPLDATFIHPESYTILQNWSTSNKTSLEQLINDPTALDKLKKDSGLKKELGDFTFEDIIKSLQAPSQDPRTEFKSFEFRKDIKDINDLKVDQWYPGIVTNITQFGAFVDIGIKENGLLHISQIADKFVQDPLAELQLGQQLNVRVKDVDHARKRVALSLKKIDVNDQYHDAPTNNKSRTKSSSNNQRPQTIKNNAFAGLKNLNFK